MKLFRPTTILFAGLLLALCSCHEKITTLTQPNEKPKHIKEAKPGAAIKLVSNAVTSINANQIAQVELVFDVRETEGTLNIELSPTTGLDILDTQMIQSIKLSSTTTIKIPVKLHAVIDGRYYLNIHASIDSGDSLSNRSLALIVQVGAEKEKSNQLKKNSGDNVISLPAQETISN